MHFNTLPLAARLAIAVVGALATIGGAAIMVIATVMASWPKDPSEYPD